MPGIIDKKLKWYVSEKHPLLNAKNILLSNILKIYMCFWKIFTLNIKNTNHKKYPVRICMYF